MITLQIKNAGDKIVARAIENGKRINEFDITMRKEYNPYDMYSAEVTAKHMVSNLIRWIGDSNNGDPYNGYGRAKDKVAYISNRYNKQYRDWRFYLEDDLIEFLINNGDIHVTETRFEYIWFDDIRWNGPGWYANTVDGYAVRITYDEARKGSAYGTVRYIETLEGITYIGGFMHSGIDVYREYTNGYEQVFEFLPNGQPNMNAL